MSHDLGDVITLTVNIADSAGDAANAGSVAATITLPDLTTTSPAVSNPSTGSYQVSYTPTQVGLHRVSWVATGANASGYSDTFIVTDMGQSSIVSLSEVRAFLNMTATTSDEEVRDAILDATAAAEHYTSRALAPREVTDTFDGGVTALMLSTPCAMSISAVTEDGTSLTSSDYRLRHGVTVERINGGVRWGWSGLADAVSVTYIAGVTGRDLYAARRGVLGIIQHLWATQRGAMNIGPQTTDQWLPGMGYAIPNRAAQLLEPLRMLGNG